MANDSKSGVPEAQKLQVPEYMVGKWKLVSLISYEKGDTSRITPEDAGVSLVSINNADGSFTDILNGKETKGVFYLKSDTAIFDYDNDTKRLFTYSFSNDTLYYTGRINGLLMTSAFMIDK
ncbi:hypothetical protein C900_01690 [Fulvivirga imtechensis AK7]|uniref:Lipocalin-like domain-containing protein n=1 Tax=Fulvivirga imtechensis AK7 TaxID=1237149 RepID=L8JU33_9BACT|nr:hypothetical protein C900_01690 [Fulvivirga imtechensis AK7]